MVITFIGHADITISDEKREKNKELSVGTNQKRK